MEELRLTEAAEADILQILIWSEAEFGQAARHRYERLIATGLHDVANDPLRPGSLARPELGEGVRSWHLRSSRERARTADGVVNRPRHFVIYRAMGDVIVIGRILHDAMELERHLHELGDWD